MVHITVNNKSKEAKAFLEFVKKLPFIKIETEKSPYNPEFVKMIKKSAASKNRTVINTKDVWGSLGLK